MSGHTIREAQRTSAADALILIAADVLDDLEGVRIATENRLRSLTTPPAEGERGGWFGKGLDPDMPEVRRTAVILDGLRDLEHQAELDLKRAMRKHPLGPWVARTVGVGEKQAARLLAAVGDPGARATVSQLWAYCGYHVLHPGHRCRDPQITGVGVDPSASTSQTSIGTQVPDAGAGSIEGHPAQGCTDAHAAPGGVAPKRRRGQKANWSTTAKTRAFLIAESCIKQARSPYRAVYDAGRAKYADAVHTAPCERCGPSGKPAPAGSPLSAGHQHARAMRLVSKALLKDLWIEARQIATTSQPRTGTHAGIAGGGTPTAPVVPTPNVAAPSGPSTQTGEAA